MALEVEDSFSHKLLGSLKDAFEESPLPYTVDVVDLNRVGDSFKKIVEFQRAPLPLDEHGTGQQVQLTDSLADGANGGVAALSVTSGQWCEVTLGEVCTKIGSGTTPRGGRDVYFQDGPYTLIRRQNIYNDGFHRDDLAFIGQQHADELQSVEVLDGDVLLNITGDSVARVCQVAPDVLPARVNQHVAIIRPDPSYFRHP